MRYRTDLLALERICILVDAYCIVFVALVGTRAHHHSRQHGYGVALPGSLEAPRPGQPE